MFHFIPNRSYRQWQINVMSIVELSERTLCHNTGTWKRLDVPIFYIPKSFDFHTICDTFLAECVCNRKERQHMLKKILSILKKLKPIETPSSCLAVLLIDMQDYYTRRLAEATREGIVAQQIQVIRTCAEKDVPLVILEYRSRGRTIPVLLDEIAKVPRAVMITKSHNNGFMGTRLDKVLRRFGAAEIAFMGINASSCVRDTADSAISLKYKIVTADNVIADEAGCEGRRKSRQWYETNGLFLESLII
jgi:isochorismate hydrolase